MENRQEIARGSPLTRRQQAVYEHLRARAREYPERSPPSLDELCRELGMRSRGSLHKHIQALIEAGVVEPLRGRRRGIRLRAAATDEPDQLPLLGTIVAGSPLEAVEYPELIEVPGALRSARRCFVLRVRGDSMVEDGVLDGDWIVVEERAHARNGEIVVALIDDAEATLKRIEQRPGDLVLHPANSAMAPLHFSPDRVRIQGAVVGLMRRYPSK
jgi:repressor LexA